MFIPYTIIQTFAQRLGLDQLHFNGGIDYIWFVGTVTDRGKATPEAICVCARDHILAIKQTLTGARLASLDTDIILPQWHTIDRNVGPYEFGSQFFALWGVLVDQTQSNSIYLPYCNQADDPNHAFYRNFHQFIKQVNTNGEPYDYPNEDDDFLLWLLQLSTFGLSGYMGGAAPPYDLVWMMHIEVEGNQSRIYNIARTKTGLYGTLHPDEARDLPLRGLDWEALWATVEHDPQGVITLDWWCGIGDFRRVSFSLPDGYNPLWAALQPLLDLLS